MFKDEILEASSNGNKTSIATLLFFHIILEVLTNVVSNMRDRNKSYHFEKDTFRQ